MTAEIIKNLKENKRIILELNNDIFCSEIIENLKTNTSVQILEIDLYDLTYDNVKVFVENLNNFKNIKELVIGFKDNGDNEILLNKLKHNDIIECLVLHRGRFYTDLPKKLSELLKINTSINSLMIRGYCDINNLNEPIHFYDVLKYNTNIKTLGFYFNLDLINVLKINKSIKILENLFIDENNKEIFIDFLKENKNILCKKISFHLRIDERFDYFENCIDSNEAEYAARIFKFNIYQLKFLGKIPRYIIEMMKSTI
jgi:hypothetical protein